MIPREPVPPYEAIRNLLGVYNERLDAGDLEALGQLFADAVLLDDKGQEIARGAAEATKLWTKLVQLYDGSPRTRHIVAGPIITVDGDMATCQSSYVMFQQREGKIEPLAAGRYRDTFACDNGTWRFAARQFFLDQSGDLSTHLAGM